MKLIGKGSFTRAYLKDEKTIILKSCDPIKECMANGWFPESKLFPKIEQIDEETYQMEYLGKTPKSLKSLRPRQLRLYNALRKAFDGGFATLGTPSNQTFFAWHEIFDNLPSEFKREKEVLKEALDACGNYGTDISFEISPRNIRIKNGFLVLLDCFFVASKLKQVNSW